MDDQAAACPSHGSRTSAPRTRCAPSTAGPSPSSSTTACRHRPALGRRAFMARVGVRAGGGAAGGCRRVLRRCRGAVRPWAPATRHPLRNSPGPWGTDRPHSRGHGARRRRSRTITWDDPNRRSRHPANSTGSRTFARCSPATYPPPPISRLLNFWIVSADPGEAVFECEPGEYHDNPLGMVHGGLAHAARPVVGCAAHTTLPAGVGYTRSTSTCRIYGRSVVTRACSARPAGS